MSHLRVIDYRNAKYQGQTKNYIRNGFGILMDDNFTLIIGNWTKNVLNGPCVIVYPENIIFYGSYLNGYPDGIGFFQLENMINLHCVFQQKRQRQSGKSWPRVNSKVVLTIQKPKILMQANFDKQNFDQIQILADSSYKDEQQKFKTISKILKKQIKQNMQQGWLNFLELQICKQYPNQLQITRALRGKNKQVMIGFKKSDTLGGIFSDGLYSQAISIGFYKNQYIFKDIGRKYIQTTNGKIIEQGIYNITQSTKSDRSLSHSNATVTASNVYTYHEVEQKRPIHVFRAIQKYFKQSMSFSNSFVNLAEIYKAQMVCFKVQSAMLIAKIENYAQVQLQQFSPKSDTGLKQRLFNKAIEQYEKQKNAVFQQWTLQKVKAELYEVIKRKNKVGKIRTSNIKNWQSPPKSQNRTSQNSSPYRQSRIRKISEIIENQQKKSLSRIKHRQFSPQFSRKNNKGGATPQRNDKYNKSSQSKNKKSPNRYNYIPIQSLEYLTKDYQDVQKKLLEQTPKAKKVNNFTRKYMYNSKLRDYSYDKLEKSPSKSQSKNRHVLFKYKY